MAEGGKQTKNCIVCGKEFEVPAYRAESAKFCSPECYQKHRVQDKGKIEIICKVCGKKILVYPSRKDAKYCGRKCMGKAREGVPRDEETRKSIAEGVIKRYGYTDADREKPCAVCGDPVRRFPSRLGENPTCSQECFHKLLKTDPRVKEGALRGGNKIGAYRKKHGLSEAHKQAIRDAKARSGKRKKYECGWCGKKVLKYKSEAEKYEEVFCSVECKDSWLQAFSVRGKDHPSYGVPPPPGAGRCKWYDYESPVAGHVKLQGSLELRFAKLLDESGLKWVRPTKDRFPYTGLDGVEHTYNPDFKVWIRDEEFVYVETKGYEDEACRIKLEAVLELIPLCIVREDDVQRIEGGTSLSSIVRLE